MSVNVVMYVFVRIPMLVCLYGCLYVVLIKHIMCVCMVCVCVCVCVCVSVCKCDQCILLTSCTLVY